MINLKILSTIIQFLRVKFILIVILELWIKVLIFIILDQFLQFERRCYIKIDKVELRNGDLEYDLFFVPDGKKVGLAAIKTAIDKQGDIKKKDLAQKVE